MHQEKPGANKGPGKCQITSHGGSVRARFASDNPAWTVTRLMREMGWPEGLAKKVSTILGFSRDGVEDLKGVEALREFMVEHNLLARGAVPRLEELYTTDLVPVS